MSRNVAILLVTLTTILCGLPGLGLMCVGVLAGIGTQMPNYKLQGSSSPENVLIGSLIFLCFGAILLVFPLIVGFFSFRLNRLSEAAADNSNSLPPLP
jgi:Zn-dependent protease with chaperone function